VLEEERLESVLRPVIHGEGEQLHRNRVHTKEIADEHDLQINQSTGIGRVSERQLTLIALSTHLINLFIHCTHTRYEPNVVCYCN
jgi:hypothetical protein